MSARGAYAAVTSVPLEMVPPIAGSSVPRCPCSNHQPCPCEAYGRRLELSQRIYVRHAIVASGELHHLADVLADVDCLDATLVLRAIAGGLF
jgi:hypothetical protein